MGVKTGGEINSKKLNIMPLILETKVFTLGIKLDILNLIDRIKKKLIDHI
jgi:hypothetical protein